MNIPSWIYPNLCCLKVFPHVSHVLGVFLRTNSASCFRLPHLNVPCQWSLLYPISKSRVSHRIFSTQLSISCFYSVSFFFLIWDPHKNISSIKVWVLVTIISSKPSTVTLYKKKKRGISKTRITNLYYYVPGTVLLKAPYIILTHLILSMYIRYKLLLSLFYRIKTKAHIIMSPKLVKEQFK